MSVPGKIALYHPSRDFITVSVTGRHCDLMCRHCQGRFLGHMVPAGTPGALWEVASAARERGVKGMLVSGGSDRGGAVPVFGFLDIIDKIKLELKMSVNLHTGFISPGDAGRLRGRHVDMVSFDVVGSPAAAKSVFGLDLEPDYFEGILAALRDAGVRVVPHLTAGLDMGLDSGEEKALDIIARHGPGLVVVNGLMSRDAAVEERAARRMVEVLDMARRILPRDTALAVGCMRPRRLRLKPDMLLALGVDAVAAPHPRMADELLAAGARVIEKGGCCSFHGLA